MTGIYDMIYGPKAPIKDYSDNSEIQVLKIPIKPRNSATAPQEYVASALFDILEIEGSKLIYKVKNFNEIDALAFYDPKRNLIAMLI